MSDEEDGQLSDSTTSHGSSGIRLSVSGSGVVGSVNRQANGDKRNIGTILYDSEGQVAQIYFEARPMSWDL